MLFSALMHRVVRSIFVHPAGYYIHYDCPCVLGRGGRPGAYAHRRRVTWAVREKGNVEVIKRK